MSIPYNPSNPSNGNKDGRVMLDTVDAALGELLEDQRPTLPEGCTARQFLGMVMRGEIDPPPKQINAAKVLIEYEEAKLTAVAMGYFDGTSFAAQLERCIARSE